MDGSSKRLGLNRRDLLRAGALGGLALGLGACGTDEGGQSPQTGVTKDPSVEPSAELIAAAKAEGSVTVYYGAPPQVGQSLIDGFTERYGIKVDGTQAISATSILRFTAEVEGGRPNADIMHVSDTNWIRNTAIPKGWLARPDETKIPAARLWEDNFVIDGVAFMVDISLYSILYNTDLVKPEELATWMDVINPKWKGLVILLDPRVSAVNLAFHQLQWDNWGDQWLTGLAAQNAQLTTTARAAANSIAAGDAAFLIPGNHFNITNLIETGAPIADAYPPGKTSVTGVEQFMSLVANAPHPNAAQLFMNYTLSVEGQAQMCGNKVCSSALRAPGTEALPANYASPPLAASAQNKDKIVDLLGLTGRPTATN
jgi:iron(III) transport system substrate-binding protein